MKDIVLTYFDPFGGRNFNASKATVEGIDIPARKMALPVSWNDISQRLDDIFALGPNYLFLFGEAGSIPLPRYELEAHNLAKGRDNEGVMRNEEKILEGGMDTLYTSFTVDQAFTTSRDAGTYLCNCSFYLSLYKAKRTKVIFIHVPAFNENEIEKKKQSIEIAGKMVKHLLELN